MTAIKILVAEDDVNIRIGLVDTLESEGYEVAQASDGIEALHLFNAINFDLILLDIMMPQKNGWDVCRDIRSVNENIPIIMLSAKAEEIDKVVGLELGADDYITKPFGVHELLARIFAVLRRAKKQDLKQNDAASFFVFGNCKINIRTFKLNKEGKKLDISKRELELIQLFYAHPGEVLSRDDILNKIWGIDYLGTTRTLDQHIALLRKKIEPDPAHPTVITTIHGVGYRYDI